MPEARANSLSYNEWLERKDRQVVEAKGREVLAKANAENNLKKKGKGKNAIGFDKWVALKDKYERGLSLLHQIETYRAEDNTSWFEAGVAMAATDCALILLHRDNQQTGGGDRYSTLPKLGDAWIKWTIAHHTFDNIPLTEEKASKFSALKELMTKEADGSYTLPSLKWNIKMVAKKPGDFVRPMTKDQILQNKLFKALCKQYLEKAQKEVVRHLLQARKEATLDDDDMNSDRAMRKRLNLEQRVLTKIGVQKLQRWIEEDVEEMEKKQNESKAEAYKEAKSAHDGFVRNKDKLRIRMPPQKDGVRFGGKWEPPRMDFGKGKPLVRAKKNKIAKSSVDMMKGTGSKYIHAIGKANQPGGMQELKKCRDQLLKKGFVHKSNFDDDSDDECDHNMPRYFFEKEKNIKKAIKHAQRAERTKGAEDKFEEWLRQKDLIERAEGCMDGIEPPERGEARSEDHWMQVGKALKAVNRSLFQIWADWCKDYKSAGTCRMYWESFEPIADDIMSGGPIRDILLRFLGRKGVNFEQGFDRAVRKKFLRDHFLGNVDEETFAEFEKDGDAFEYPEKYQELNQAEFIRMTRDLGFVLQKEEVLRLINCFDTDRNACIDKKEFLAFTGRKRGKARGDVDLALRKLTVWETTCHYTGMCNAYQVVVDKNDQLVRVQLEDHKKRLKVRYFRDLHTRNGQFIEPCLDLWKVKDELAPKVSQAHTWTMQQRQAGLQKLLQLSMDYRQSQKLQKMMTDGKAPDAPELIVADFRSDEAMRGQLNPTSELLLKWKPAKVTGNNAPSFFVLEYAEKPRDGSGNIAEFRELCRDPKNFAENDGMPRYIRPHKWFRAKHLRANTTYAFRLRAFNGFGASRATHKEITTAPTAPPPVTKLSARPNSVTLSWKEEIDRDAQLEELRGVFDEADTDGSGTLSRDELMEAIEEKHPRLLRWLQNCKIADTDSSGAQLSVFDVIETDDSEDLTWDEFQNFFTGASFAQSSARGEGVSDGTTYVLKRCASEADNQYVVVYSGAQTTYTVHDLRPGTSYQFRVHKKNRDGISSKHSEAVVVQTMLETPPLPTLVGHPGCSSVRLRWPGGTRRGFGGKQETQKGGRAQEATNKMLTEWTRAEEDSDGGLDLAHKFETTLAMYDQDGDGALDKEEFKMLLRDLGVNPTDTRVNEAFELLDEDRTNKLEYHEFEEWWTRDTLTYVLKRDDGYSEEQLLKEEQAVGTTLDKIAGSKSKSGKFSTLQPRNFKVTCYRGAGKQIEVLALEPNTIYHFRLRHVSSTSESFLSPPLEVMTAPQAPTKAAVIAQYAKTIDVKWHPRLGGASRYIVEAKFIETLPSAGDLSASRKKLSARRRESAPEPVWEKAYEGSDTMTTLRDLKPNSVYRLRVQAVNRLGVKSEWGVVTQCYTLEREKEPILAAHTAVRMFTIECAHDEDVVTGDTILFTERIYADPDTGRCVLEGSRSSSSSRMFGAGRSVGFDPNLSVSSVGSHGGGGGGGEVGLEYLGTRTVAARVVAESYITSKQREQARMEGRGLKPSQSMKTQAMAAARTTGAMGMYGSAGAMGMGGGVSSSQRKHRELRLQVAWCTVERKEAERFKIKKNANIERKERHLFRFETFRIRWKDDDGRRLETWMD